MNRGRARSLVAASLLLASAAPAAAQEPPVSRLLPEMINISAVIGRGETGDHRQHFIPLLFASEAVPEVNRTVLSQAAAFPLEPMSIVVNRRPPGAPPRYFGAGYTDIAFSLGPKLLLSVSYQSMTFDKIDDIDLRGSGLVFYVPHAAVTGDQSDRDMMQQIASMRLSRKSALFSLSRGWGDRFDARIVVPIVQMSADVRVVSHLIRTASSQSLGPHAYDDIDGASSTLARFCAFGESADALECNGSSTARGIGDIGLRGKFTLFQGSSALAVALDARLPTGSADELIGLGATQVKPALFWSVDAGRVGVRFRADYTWSQGDLTPRLAEEAPTLDLSVPDEIGVGIGIDTEVAPRTKLSVDVLARQIDQVREFSSGSVVFPSRGPGSLPSTAFTADDALLVGGTRSLTQVVATFGLQFDVPGGLNAQVSALVPVSGGGLRPHTTAVFALTKRY
jgi:hypothetical protein